METRTSPVLNILSGAFSQFRPRSATPAICEKPARNSNLDLLRAAAILMVVIYHVAAAWPVSRASVTAVTRFGEYGVDLFFVLSGWLIGGLLWRENERFGNVQVPRFVMRRALRTVPPYLIALGISYCAVMMARGEPFDFSYLIFLQNYQREIPFFQVSWSLCIEEHFYMVMPLIVLLLTRLSNRSHFLLLVAAILPMLFRAMSVESGELSTFGYIYTATHLRYEGLILGVWASFVYVCRPAIWKTLRQISTTGSAVTFVTVIATDRLPEIWRYVFFYSAINLFFFFLLISLVDRKPTPLTASRCVLWIASISYSLYLTNQLAIHTVVRLMERTAFLPEAVHLLVAMLGIAGAGFAFYRFVEAPSLAIRHRLIPNRGQEEGAPSPRPPKRDQMVKAQ